MLYLTHFLFFFKKKEHGAKILHGEAVESRMAAKSSFEGHEYDVCMNGCKLYGLNDNNTHCTYCRAERYSSESTATPKASMKIMSIGDILAGMLANPETKELFKYRSERESINGLYKDIFDGQDYKDMKNRGYFESPDDIAIALFTDGFTNQHKGKRTYTIVHAIILNLDPSIRYFFFSFNISSHLNEYLIFVFT